MATLTAYKQLTLVELAKRLDPKGELAAICEVLAQDNEILQDAVWMEANDVFSHKYVRRSALPTGSWRKLNAGVTTEASQTLELVEGIGMLETYAECDKELADAAPNPTQFRMDEAAAFLEGMSQTLAATLIYGDATTAPEKITGLSRRMPSLAATANVIGASGTGSDLTSIFMVQWAPRKTYLVYPRGSKSIGIKHQDLGEVTLGDATNGYYQGYRDHFQAKIGLIVEHPKSIARVANIETSGTSNLFDEDDLITLLNRMPLSGAGCVIYCNSTVKSQMEIALKDKTNVRFGTSEGLGGVPVLTFRGNPVRKVDQIVLTEAALT